MEILRAVPDLFNQVKPLMPGRIVLQGTKDFKSELFVELGRLEIKGVEIDGITPLLDCQFLRAFHQFTADSFPTSSFNDEKSANEEMVPMGPTEQSAYEAARL